MIVTLHILVQNRGYSKTVCLVLNQNSYPNQLHSFQKIFKSCLANLLLLQKDSLEQYNRCIVI